MNNLFSEAKDFTLGWIDSSAASLLIAGSFIAVADYVGLYNVNNVGKILGSTIAIASCIYLHFRNEKEIERSFTDISSQEVSYLNPVNEK